MGKAQSHTHMSARRNRGPGWRTSILCIWAGSWSSKVASASSRSASTWGAGWGAGR